MNDVAEPYMVHDPREMAGQLINGNWIVARWEHLGEDEDLDHWTAVLRGHCEELDVDPYVINIPRKSLTIVFNGALPAPTFEQLENSIAAIEYHRFLEREIGPRPLD
ncbi:hypothetical protein ED92_01455 [Amycolatopsis sp. MJM2582]|uniref:Uncharacterized protein n=2 Tax=Amycolatopsis japonica group TaxID=2893673 RepID=R4SLA3_9PSEU|nr:MULTISPECIES: hypothetical protein [Amycolatopsis]AGM03525.1 hypothetical protein AORI_0936 [Amycolatopsis keratiniphila]AIG79784.1 Hypothetical protein AJAP_34885 [Amycolatopsis japonica]KFZ82595.1 hypothetical protein ED92_01455 [Amycolatopsis sp. MJM2582]OKJ94162.1 hypothetical protein AMK34_28615 [Amycolatopsis sp. CB00013]RSN28007.1 hypothetical protein DMC61_24075 [Amycolatopsis sp. WAC 04169]